MKMTMVIKTKGRENSFNFPTIQFNFVEIGFMFNFLSQSDEGIISIACATCKQRHKKCAPKSVSSLEIPSEIKKPKSTSVIAIDH